MKLQPHQNISVEPETLSLLRSSIMIRDSSKAAAMSIDYSYLTLSSDADFTQIALRMTTHEARKVGRFCEIVGIRRKPGLQDD